MAQDEGQEAQTEETQGTAQAAVETPVPATEAAAQAALAAQTPEQRKEAEAAAAAAQPEKTPWYERRIGKLTAEKHTLEEANAQLARELALLRAGSQGQSQAQAQTQPAGLPPEEVNKRIQTEAERIAGERAFDDACNSIYDQGTTAFPDFQTKVVDNFTKLGGITRPLIEAAQATGQAHKVLYALGSDLNEAARVLALPPVRQAVEIAKIAAKVSAPAPVSQAPAPISPLGGGAAKAEPDPEKMDTKQWMDWREKQLEARRKRA